MKKFTVYLYRSPDCIRGWLSYLETIYPDYGTCVVEIEAKNGPDAQNLDITAANKGFEGVRIIKVNQSDDHWGTKNFPELKDLKVSA